MSESWSTSGVDLHLDPDAIGGRRAGLEHALRDAIRSGRLPPHTRLPSTRALAADLGLSRGTVSAAFGQLTEEGWLTARQGSGTTVAELGARRAAAPGAVPAAASPRHNLRPGQPDLASFPVAAWLRSARRALPLAPAGVWGYGDPAGRPELRTALAGYLGRVRGVLADPDQIVITSGYVQALALLTRVLRDAGATAIAMEDPGLDFHRDVAARSGLTVVPLPVDEDGACPPGLAATAGRTRAGGTAPAGTAAGSPAAGGRVSAVVLTPAHQYPTGVILRPARRRAFADWARASGGLIIEDDYDGEFRYDRQPVGAMQGVAPDHVAYVGSASKTLAPGVRLAWLVPPRHLVNAVTEAKRHDDLGTEAMGQLVLADFITSHAYDRHIRAARLRYRRRRDLLLDRLTPAPGRPVPPGLRVQGVAAGLQALISLPPDGPGEDAVLAAAARHGIDVESLAPLWHSPGDHPPGILVGFGAATERAYPAALDALARALHEASRG